MYSAVARSDLQALAQGPSFGVNLLEGVYQVYGRPSFPLNCLDTCVCYPKFLKTNS